MKVNKCDINLNTSINKPARLLVAPIKQGLVIGYGVARKKVTPFL